MLRRGPNPAKPNNLTAYMAKTRLINQCAEHLPTDGFPMSHFLDRLTFFRQRTEKFSDGHGIATDESRDWEDAYRKRWAADKIVRSTHP